MTASRHVQLRTPEAIWLGGIAAAAVLAAIASVGAARPGPGASGRALEVSPSPGQPSSSLTWRLNNPAPFVVPESLANPAAVADKFAARARSIEQRASLRAYEGAPPVIPHPIADLNIQTCRSCHALGLVTGDKVAHMVSHTYLVNCTQCHVESQSPMLADDEWIANSFRGLRLSGYGGTRAWAGAPPVMPHTTFMRTNCVSCHGEHGYDGWRPDHLSRTNCVQCHTPAAEFDQLSPTFGLPDVPDGLIDAAPR